MKKTTSTNNKKKSGIKKNIPAVQPKAEEFSVEIVEVDEEKSSQAALIESGKHVHIFAAAWGWNSQERAGNLTKDEIHIPRQIQHSKLQDYIHSAVGTQHTLLVSQEGNVFSLGDGRKGQLGYGNLFTGEPVKGGIMQAFPRHITPSGNLKFGRDIQVAQVAAGGTFSIAREASPAEGTRVVQRFLPLETAMQRLVDCYPDSGAVRRAWSYIRQERFIINRRAEGVVIAWGTGKYGELGLEENNMYTPYPQAIFRFIGTTIIHISAGQRHVLAIDNFGRLYSWGCGRSGRLGHNDFDHRYSPEIVSFFLSMAVLSCAAGDAHSLVLTTSKGSSSSSSFTPAAARKVLAFGRGAHGRLGSGSNRNSPIPLLIRKFPPSVSNTTIVSIAAGGAHSLCLHKRSVPKGLVFPFGVQTFITAWGYGTNGQLGTGYAVDSFLPIKTLLPKAIVITSISAGRSYSTAVSVSGQLFTWGKGLRGQLAQGEKIEFSLVPREVLSHMATVQVASGMTHVTAIYVNKKELNIKKMEGIMKENPVYDPFEVSPLLQLKQRMSTSLFQFDCCRRVTSVVYKDTLGKSRFRCRDCMLDDICYRCALLCHRTHHRELIIPPHHKSQQCQQLPAEQGEEKHVSGGISLNQFLFPRKLTAKRRKDAVEFMPASNHFASQHLHPDSTQTATVSSKGKKRVMMDESSHHPRLYFTRALYTSSALADNKAKMAQSRSKSRSDDSDDDGRRHRGLVPEAANSKGGGGREKDRSGSSSSKSPAKTRPTAASNTAAAAAAAAVAAAAAADAAADAKKKGKENSSKEKGRQPTPSKDRDNKDKGSRNATPSRNKDRDSKGTSSRDSTPLRNSSNRNRRPSNERPRRPSDSSTDSHTHTNHAATSSKESKPNDHRNHHPPAPITVKAVAASESRVAACQCSLFYSSCHLLPNITEAPEELLLNSLDSYYTNLRSSVSVSVASTRRKGFLRGSASATNANSAKKMSFAHNPGSRSPHRAGGVGGGGIQLVGEGIRQAAQAAQFAATRLLPQSFVTAERRLSPQERDEEGEDEENERQVAAIRRGSFLPQQPSQSNTAATTIKQQHQPYQSPSHQADVILAQKAQHGRDYLDFFIVKIQSLARGFICRKNVFRLKQKLMATRRKVCAAYVKREIFGKVFDKVDREYARYREEVELADMQYEDQLTQRFNSYKKLQRAIMGLSAVKFGLRHIIGQMGILLPILDDHGLPKRWYPTFAFTLKSLVLQQLIMNRNYRFTSETLSELTAFYPRFAGATNSYREGKSMDYDISVIIQPYLRDMDRVFRQMNALKREDEMKEKREKMRIIALEQLQKNNETAVQRAQRLLQQAQLAREGLTQANNDEDEDEEELLQAKRRYKPPKNEWKVALAQYARVFPARDEARILQETRFSSFRPPYSVKYPVRRYTLSDPLRLHKRVLRTVGEIRGKAFLQRRDSLPSFSAWQRARYLFGPMPFPMRSVAIKSIDNSLFLFKQREKEVKGLYAELEVFDKAKDDDINAISRRAYLRHNVKVILLQSALLTPRLPQEINLLLREPTRRRTIASPERLASQVSTLVNIREAVANSANTALDALAISRHRRSFDYGEDRDFITGPDLLQRSLGLVCEVNRDTDTLGGVTGSSLKKDASEMDERMIAAGFTDAERPVARRTRFKLMMHGAYGKRDANSRNHSDPASSSRRPGSSPSDQSSRSAMMVGKKSRSAKKQKGGLISVAAGKVNLSRSKSSTSGKTTPKAAPMPKLMKDELEEAIIEGENEDDDDASTYYDFENNYAGSSSAGAAAVYDYNNGEVEVWQELYAPPEYEGEEAAVYYYNAVTGQSSWDLPTASVNSSQVQIETQHEDEYGRWYWYNNSTGESRWVEEY